MDDQTRIELEAAAFRRLQKHLMEDRTDAQNIDMMNLAGFCRNCLSRWYQEAANDSVTEWLVHLHLFVHCACVFPSFVFAQDAVVVREIALGLHERPTKKRRVILTPNLIYAEHVVSWEIVSTLTMRCLWLFLLCCHWID